MGDMVLVAGGSIKCSHGAVMQLMGGDNRLKVDRNAVITSGMEVNLTFLACPSTMPNGTPKPCMTEQATSGVATKMTVGGTPVLLATAGGLTVSGDPPGTSSWQVANAGQTKLSAT